MWIGNYVHTVNNFKKGKKTCLVKYREYDVYFKKEKIQMFTDIHIKLSIVHKENKSES